MSPYLAEFLGTMLLIVLGNGVVASVILRGTKSENAGWLTIVFGWGLAVTLAVYAVGRISQAHLNPAITIAIFVNGDFPGEQVVGYILAQLAGAFCGAVIVYLYFFLYWERTQDQATKLAVFCTGPAIRSPLSNLFNEAFATMILVLAILFIGANKFAEGLNPLVIGALIVSIGLSLGSTTGFAINPARDFAPRLAHFVLPIPGKGHSDWSYAWIPVVGPIIGGLAGSWLFKMLF
ncbi:MAG TPA: MIP/aquaporin family protein [Chryseosolibacter sp.]|nr:MIP/aquaporin family protein [Chryseosolibacter sp.]